MGVVIVREQPPGHPSLLWSSLSDLPILRQVHDDAGLLARSALSETHVQTAGGRPGPHCGLDLQPGRAGPWGIIACVDT